MEKQRAEYYDYNLIAVILLLVGFGLVMLYSTSAYTAELQHGDDMYFFARQARVSIASILLAVGLSFVDYHYLWNLGWVSYIGSAVLMLLVKTPLGVEVNGAKRWLNLGITFQPSEIAKIAIIIFVPMLIAQQGKAFRGLKACAAPFMAGLVLSLITYIFTDNLSTAVIILGIDVLIIFVAHPKTRPFIIAFAVLTVLAVIGTIIIWRVAENAPVDSFRLRRILVWKDPEKYITEGGYQVMQSLYAIGSGGVFGKGLGNSMQKLGWLPEAQNDMIFPIIAGPLRCSYSYRRIFPYCPSGRSQHLRGPGNTADNRCDPAFHQLRRNFGPFPDDGNGFSPVRIENDPIKESCQGPLG